MPDHFPETLIEIEGPLGALAVEASGRIELTRDGRMRRSVTRYRYADWMEPRWAMSQAGALEACRHFLGAFRAGRPAETSGADNLRTLALVEAAYRSAERATRSRRSRSSRHEERPCMPQTTPR